LCRDKLTVHRCLRAANLPTPDTLEANNPLAQDALSSWEGGFLKPQFGAFGAGIQRIQAGDAFATRVEGLRPGWREPALIQEAITPPDLVWQGQRVAGLALRVLVQRASRGDWVANPIVARVSVDDPVVNVRRGAFALPLGDLLDTHVNTPHALQSVVTTLAIACIRALNASLPDDVLCLEAGVDIVLDAAFQPWVIEVNGMPRGHIRALATQWPTRFDLAQRRASLRPLEYLMARM